MFLFVCLFVVAPAVVVGFFLLGTNGSIFNLINTPLVCERLPKTYLGMPQEGYFSAVLRLIA